MKRLKFDYIKIFNHKRPIIPVQLSANNKSVNIPALIDSGADFNLFPLDLAEVLGVKLNLKKPIEYKGVGGDKFNMKGYLSIVSVRTYSKGEFLSFDSPVVFTDQIPSNGFALLGETGFFDKIQKVEFWYKRGKIIIEV